LKRPGAADDYSHEIQEQAWHIAAKMSKKEADQLVYVIIMLTQGFINGAIDDTVSDPKAVFLEYLSKYNKIDREQLRTNLKSLLDDVVPVAEKFGINLCIHPDDPPFSVLGLPRIVSTIDDLEWISKANPSPNNGFAYCVGSLSARSDNDLPEMVRRFGDRIHFAHLRNTQVLENGSFYESGHLTGSQDMAAIVEQLLLEQRRRMVAGRKDYRMPFRPDHGIRILQDYKIKHNPGYPLIGRLKGMAEIEGLMVGIERSL
jgi:mannonate dehydratase